MKVAVVGGGMAGLVAAYHLSQSDDVEVTIFERQSRLGLGAARVQVPLTDGKVTDVDIPARVLVVGYYNELLALFKHIGVELQPCDVATSYGVGSTTDFCHKNIRLGRFTMPNPMALNVFSAKFWKYASCFVRLNIEGEADLASGLFDEVERPPTLHEYLDAGSYPQDFREEVLYPMFATVCTCPLSYMSSYPAKNVLTLLTSFSSLKPDALYRTKNGMADVMQRLTANVDSVNTGVSIAKLEPKQNGGVRVSYYRNGQTDDVQMQEFDHVVLATQAPQAAQLLREIDPTLVQSLDEIETMTSEVIVHRDQSVMPVNKSHWCPMNIRRTVDGSEAMITAYMNSLQPELAGEDLTLETWNPIIQPDPSKVLGRFHFCRPRITAQHSRLADEIGRHQGLMDIWVCGAYSVDGLALLEECTRSALLVSTAITGRVPEWKQHRIATKLNSIPMKANPVAVAITDVKDVVYGMIAVVIGLMTGWIVRLIQVCFIGSSGQTWADQARIQVAESVERRRHMIATTPLKAGALYENETEAVEIIGAKMIPAG
eukprot:Clim_evm1s13 gene=Clim_evmTU1s13